MAFFGTVLVTGDFYANTFVTPLLAIGNYEFLESPMAGVLRLWFPTEFGILGVAWILFAVATVRARVYPRRAAWLLLVGAALALVPLPFVNIAFDVAIIWLGLTLMKQDTSSPWSRRHLRRTPKPRAFTGVAQCKPDTKPWDSSTSFAGSPPVTAAPSARSSPATAARISAPGWRWPYRAYPFQWSRKECIRR